MAHLRNMSIQSLPFRLPALLLLLLHLGSCYPIHPFYPTESSTVSTWGSVRFISKYAARGVWQDRTRSTRPGHATNIWTAKNKLAVGLGIGLGVLFRKYRPGPELGDGEAN